MESEIESEAELNKHQPVYILPAVQDQLKTTSKDKETISNHKSIRENLGNQSIFFVCKLRLKDFDYSPFRWVG